jgi:hypothetical protein
MTTNERFRVWIDDWGLARLEADPILEGLIDFFESDLQGVPDEARALISIVDDLRTAKIEQTEWRGNTFVVKLNTRTAAFSSVVYGESFEVDLEEFRAVVDAWAKALQQ